jgi:maltose/moltooligosaccharide transporter
VLSSIWLARQAIYQVMILSAGIGLAGALLVAGGALQRGGRWNNGFVTILNDFLDMPRTMKQLAWAQFFSWFALFAMWIYTTAAVTSHVYGTTDTTSALYNEGANWVGVGFAAYNGVAAVVAFAIPPLARWSSPKVAHLTPAAAPRDCCRSTSSRPRHAARLDGGVGIAWASISRCHAS